MDNISSKIQNLHQFFYTRRTYDINFRLYALKKLKKAIQEKQEEIVFALYQDFKKPVFETYMTEIYATINELNYAISHLRRWAKPKIRNGVLPLLGSYTQIIPEPYGVVLIYSPFNYPLHLALTPLIGALAAGNCAILKPSEYTPHTNNVLKKIIQRVFPPSYVIVAEGDGEFSSKLLEEPIDYVFFTGGIETGKKIMRKAADSLIPVTLELGGKSPVIVDYDANIPLAAKRIVWGKFLNAGQTCVAPDYILAHSLIADDLLKEMKKVIQKFYENNNDMASIIHEEHYVRLLKCIDEDKIYYGGHFNTDKLYISPTILYPASIHDESMKEEIFGPILPVIPFRKLDKAVQIIQRFPKPLACYIFGYDPLRINHLVKHISFGGGCINDTVLHVSNVHAPFGGVGYSGIGSYHGYYSFKTFSHYKTVLHSVEKELPLRYPPYDKKTRLIKKVFIKEEKY